MTGEPMASTGQDGEQLFTITIASTHPDAVAIVRLAAETIASRIGWGDDQHAAIVAVRNHDNGPPEHLASWEMEPG